MKMSSSISPTTSFLIPSKALMVALEVRMSSSFIPKFLSVANGHMLNADPLSISTWEICLPWLLADMYKALLWAQPSIGTSSSEKDIWSLSSMVPTKSSNCTSLIVSGTCTSFSTFISAFLCFSELVKRSSSDIWAGIFLSCSMTSNSLVLTMDSAFSASSLVTSLLSGSPSLGA